MTPLMDVTVSLSPSSPSAPQLNFCLLAYPLQLATAFGTSHSSSSCRHNALLLLRRPLSPPPARPLPHLSGVEETKWSLAGVGEVGLPPKKELVYEADLDDIAVYVNSFIECLQSQHHQQVSASVDSTQQDVFKLLPHKYFTEARSGSHSEAHITDDLSSTQFINLLHVLDNCPCNDQTFARAGRALIESAVFDAWSHSLKIPLHELMNVSPISNSHLSFYTAALNEDISLIVEAALFGAKHTPQLKIKLNDSVKRSQLILHALNEALPHVEGQRWSIDANSAWSPDIAEQMLNDVLQPYKHRIYMIEQPFPVDVHLKSNYDRWIEVKAKYNACDIFIFADESMRTSLDVSLLAPIVNGVNIKLEKCGGLRAAILAVEEALKFDLLVWFGCMVGSNINSTTTAHMFSLACCSDLDGALLVTESSKMFTGGFDYAMPFGNIILPSKEKGCYGIGVRPKAEFFDVICGR